MCICFIPQFKVQNQSYCAHYSQGFCQSKNCNTVIFPAAPPSVPAVCGPPQGRSKKVVTGKTHNEHCPAYLGPENLALKNELKHNIINFKRWKNNCWFVLCTLLKHVSLQARPKWSWIQRELAMPKTTTVCWPFYREQQKEMQLLVRI